MITVQLHTDAASSNSSTPFTTTSAWSNRATIEKDAAGSFTMGLLLTLNEPGA